MEKAKHEEAIERLCSEFPDRSDFVRSCYLEVLGKVATDATIRTYLPVLITREVKTLLKIQELTNSD